MILLRASLVGILVVIQPAVIVSASSPAEQLLQRAFDNYYARDSVQLFDTITVSRTGKPVTNRVVLYRSEIEVPGSILIRVVSPPRVRGTSILVRSRQSGIDSVFVFIPALAATRRLAGSQMSDQLLGTALSFDDLRSKRVSSFRDVKLVNESRQDRCVVVSALPKAELGVEYDRLQACIDPVSGVIYRMDMYETDRHVKSISSDLESVKMIGTHAIPFSITVRSIRSRVETTLRLIEHEYVERIPARFFSVENLGRDLGASDLTGVRRDFD